MTPNVDDFNPYHTWLGLDRSVTQPNYYQLLGIDQHERDSQKIAAAAERVMIRVRGFRPGSRSAQWAHLLDEINAARACLMDPARRAQYDRQLATSGATAARSFSRPAPRGSTITPGAVPMGAPLQASPAAPQTRAVPMSAPSPASSPTPSQTGGPYTGAPVAGTPAGAAGHGPANVPTGIPVGSVAAGVPVMGTPRSPGVVTGKNKIAATRQTKRSMTSAVIIAVAACLFLFGIILLLVMFGSEPTKKPSPQSQPLSRSHPTRDASRPRSRPVRKRSTAGTSLPSTTEYSAKRDLTVTEQTGQSDTDAASTGTGEEEPWTLPAFPKLDTSLEPKQKPEPEPKEKLSPVTEAASAPADTEPSGPDGESAAPKPQVSEPETPGPQVIDMPEVGTEPPATPETASPESAPQSRPEDLTAFATAMKAARTAASEGKFDAALGELEKVASVPKSAEHQAKYDRLNLLAQHARNFRSALLKSIAALEAGDEIEVGTSSVVGVVGTTANSITVRVQGANRTYSIDTLPAGLAVAIADTWLNKEEAVSLVMKAAYLATLKDADAQQLTKARQWFQEASSKDQDTADLEKVLDDTYDF